LGIRLDDAANANDSMRISAKDALVLVLLVPTDEWSILARDASAFV